MNIKNVYPSVKKVILWDLDRTVINSDHRVLPCYTENGDLDLVKYSREACTHEKIMNDSLLPLVEYMRHSLNQPDTVNIIVTARLMRKSDYVFLRKQGLRGRGKNNVMALSRDTLHKHFKHEDVNSIYYSSDSKYKTKYFELVKAMYPNAEFTMYDDHKGVLEAAARFGFKTMDAVALNDILSIGIRLATESFIEETMNDDNDFEYLKQRLEFCWQGMTDEEREQYSVNPNSTMMKLLAS